MTDFEQKSQTFWRWLEKNNATLSEKIAIQDYRSEGAGRGVVATEDIKEGELLFSLPRSILLSPLTSEVAKMDGLKEEISQLNGWSPLFVCMMYEIQKENSFWKPYFDVLPKQFSTPMFWQQQELKELEGTDIPSKIGKEEAEALFENEIKPLFEKYPNVFKPEIHTLDLFHTCGSLIMAYSFNDELQNEKKGEEEEEEEEEDEDEEEDTSFIAMVPMADMLNHKTGYNNARLFHETDSLQMRAIKDIQKGQQIYNTYGDLCNADLLRKYGFTDEKNEFDLVEIDGPLVVQNCCPDQDKLLVEKKIDFLMEEGVLDECFVIDTTYEIPAELIVSVHVLSTSLDEFEKMEERQKLPKPRLTKEAKDTIRAVLEQRLSRYPTSLEDDISLLEATTDVNKKNALIVRTGEKKILKAALATLDSMPTVAMDTNKRSASKPTQQKDRKKQKV